MAPELIHKIGLSGWLAFEDVCALALSCKRMKSIIVDDDYGRDIHHALKGVMENVRGRRWRSARYAVRRKWFVRRKEDEESLWRKVAEVVEGRKKIVLEGEGELGGWEGVMMAALSLPGARGCLESWDHLRHRRRFKMCLLYIAARVGSVRVVDWVVERGGDLEARNGWDDTPLITACIAGSLGVVRRLIEYGADVRSKGRWERNALHGACESGDVGVVELVLGVGVLDVGEGDKTGMTPLYIACGLGHLDVVKLLVEERWGVDVNKGERMGRTPLFRACEKGWVEVVQVLLEAGADA